MEIETYYELVALRQQENEITKFTGPIVINLKEAANIAEQFYSKIDVDNHTLSNRQKIAKLAEKFHIQANTLTKEVKYSLQLLADRETLVIESAHQPTLFPYSGTMIKPVMVHLIAEILRKQGLPVVELFGLLDTDDLKTGWHRRTHLPDIASKDGILIIRKETASKKQILNATTPPTLEEVMIWKELLINWVKQNKKGINRIAISMQKGRGISHEKEKFLFEQIKEIFDLLLEIQAKADSSGLFNSFFLTQLINKYWDYPTLFVPHSSSMCVFSQEIKKLIDNRNRYIEMHNKHRELIGKYININFNDVSQNYFPFWYICDCGVKIRLFVENDVLKGECEECGKNIELNLNETNNYCEKLSPQAISRHLMFFNGLKPSAYVSGWGAMPFTLVAKGISDDLSSYFPPIIPYRINIRQCGIGKLRALLELKQKGISIMEIDNKIERFESNSQKLREDKKYSEYKDVKRDLNDLFAIKNALDCHPSILDYWINFGIKQTRDNWETFIKTHEF